MCEAYAQVKAAFVAATDKKYDDFNKPIVNSEYPTLGVRTPVVKGLAKTVPLARRDDILDDFFRDDEKTYESVLFAGCLAARKADYAATRALLGLSLIHI